MFFIIHINCPQIRSCFYWRLLQSWIPSPIHNIVNELWNLSKAHSHYIYMDINNQIIYLILNRTILWLCLWLAFQIFLSFFWFYILYCINYLITHYYFPKGCHRLQNINIQFIYRVLDVPLKMYLNTTNSVSKSSCFFAVKLSNHVAKCGKKSYTMVIVAVKCCLQRHHSNVGGQHMSESKFCTYSCLGILKAAYMCPSLPLISHNPVHSCIEHFVYKCKFLTSVFHI